MRYKAIKVPKDLKGLYTEHMVPMWEQKKLVADETENLIKLRDSLLPLLMNGQVSVNYDLSAFSSSSVQNLLSVAELALAV